MASISIEKFFFHTAEASSNKGLLTRRRKLFSVVQRAVAALHFFTANANGLFLPPIEHRAPFGLSNDRNNLGVDMYLQPCNTIPFVYRHMKCISSINTLLLIANLVALEKTMHA